MDDERLVFSNPVVRGSGNDDHGDPFILRHLDQYFLYHSGNTAGRRGISVYQADDLVHREPRGIALHPNDDEYAWHWTDVWAP